MKLANFLFLIVLIVACNKNKVDYQIKPKVAFIEKGELRVPIDNETNFYPRVYGFSHQVKLFYLWNELNSQLYLFDLETKELAYKIPIEIGPSTGINSVDMVYLQSLDLVYLFDKRSMKLHSYHIPSKQIISYQILETDKGDPASDPVSNSFWVDSKLNVYLTLKPIPEQTLDEKNFALLKYNLNSGVKSFLLPYPEDYKNDKTKQFRRTFFTLTNDEKIVFTFPYEQSFIVIDPITRNQNSISSVTMLMKPYFRPKENFSDDREANYWFYSLSSWIDIVYDPYRNYIYHIGRIGYEIPDNDTIEPYTLRKSINGDNIYSTVNVFDKDFNHIAEIPGQPFKGIVKPIVTPRGILQLVGERDGRLDEDVLLFHIYEVAPID